MLQVADILLRIWIGGTIYVLLPIIAYQEWRKDNGR